MKNGRLTSAILEIRATGNTKRDDRRYLDKLHELRSYRFAGVAVEHVISQQGGGDLEHPCLVPDFGHNGRCKCKNPELHGVHRYFGIALVMAEPVDADILGTYQVGDGARLDLCGLEGTCAPKYDAEKLA